jgi:uncharacterized protein YjbJ (UPF0337 family)
MTSKQKELDEELIKWYGDKEYNDYYLNTGIPTEDIMCDLHSRDQIMRLDAVKEFWEKIKGKTKEPGKYITGFEQGVFEGHNDEVTGQSSLANKLISEMEGKI